MDSGRGGRGRNGREKTMDGLWLEGKMEEKYGQWTRGKGKKRKGEKPKKGK
jgi:hypothetical protein